MFATSLIINFILRSDTVSISMVTHQFFALLFKFASISFVVP